MKIRNQALCLSLLCLQTAALAQQEGHWLSNQWLKAGFSEQGKTWRLTRVERINGTDALAIADDGFEVVRFNGNRYTLEDYAVMDVATKTEGEVQTLAFTCVPLKSGTDAPAEVKLEYRLDRQPELHKTVRLKLAEGDKIDRLEVWRLSTPAKASRGGDNGQPVFVGEWFLGLEYPFFYSRHSDNFVPPAFRYGAHYTIDLEGGAKEHAPRPGLIRVFHFPNKAKPQPGGAWGIVSKRGVIGLPEKPGDGPELALFDYINRTRPPVRSHLHFNNWFTTESKHLTVDGFGTKLTKELKEPLARYGAKLDAMVPDDGWQEKRTFRRIYTPSTQHNPIDRVAAAVRSQGVDFGIWVGMFWRGAKPDDASRTGYRLAYPDGKGLPPKPFTQCFDITQEKYRNDYKESMRWLIQDCGVSYIKHDFNYMLHGYAAPRHAREEAADAMLDLIAYERSLDQNLLINFTNGTMFTPFLLQWMNYIWMNSGDAGSRFVFPQLSRLDVATSYRDNHFYQSWNNPSKTVRPLVPIANFMTHGVLHATRVRYFDDGDTLADWANYAMMYVGRGTLLKELYLSPDQVTEPMWEALGKACAWSQANTDLLRNTWFFGGDCDAGETYGYISWQGERGILTVRNPDRLEKELKVPFDKTVYYRGETGTAFRARAIYPFTEEMPWKLTSGTDFTIRIPGDSVMSFELEAGAPKSSRMITPQPLPEVNAKAQGETFEIGLRVPDEIAKRYDLVVLVKHAGASKDNGTQRAAPSPASVLVDDVAIQAQRSRSGIDFTISSFDLRAYRGRSIVVKGDVKNKAGDGGTVQPAAWLVCDRPVAEATAATFEGKVLPMQISRGYRHQSQVLIAP